MTKKLPISLLLLTTAMMSFPALADSEPTYNRIVLSASSTTEVEEDLLSVRLDVTEQSAIPAESEQAVNRRTTQIIELLKNTPAVKVSTTSYRTSPVYKDSKVVHWETRQTVSLSSLDQALVGDSILKIGDMATVGSMTYSVSREQHENTVNGLIDDAVAHFNQKATRLTKLNNAACYRLVSMGVQEDRMSQAPLFRGNFQMMTAKASDSDIPPAMASGEKTISVNVNGEIELLYADTSEPEDCHSGD